MVSRYSHAATGPEEKEEWIRKVPLMVLVYEGIVAQVQMSILASVTIVPGIRLRLCTIVRDDSYTSNLLQYLTGGSKRPRRAPVRHTHALRTECPVVRELDLCNALKLSSKEHQSVTAYQISFKGQKLLEFLSIEDRQDVDSFIFAPSMESVRHTCQISATEWLHF